MSVNRFTLTAIMEDRNSHMYEARAARTVEYRRHHVRRAKELNKTLVRLRNDEKVEIYNAGAIAREV